MLRTSVTPDDFTFTDDTDRPVVLSDGGKCAFVRAFEERMQALVLHPEGSDNGPRQVAYRRCIASAANGAGDPAWNGIPTFALR